MNKLDIEPIKERLSKTTKGPWSVVYKEGIAIENENLGEGVQSEIVACDSGVVRYSDSDFIANSITDIPALINEIERLVNGIAFIQNNTSCDDTWDYLNNLLQGTEEKAQIYRFEKNKASTAQPL